MKGDSLPFHVEIQDDELLGAIERAIARLQSPKALNQNIGGVLESRAAGRFESKTDPTGKAWAPLSPATIDIYTSDWFKAQPGNEAFERGIPGSLLERTGQLRDSLAFNAGDDYVEIGTWRRVGQWQVGWLMETGTRKMPRRGFLVGDPDTGELASGDRDAVLSSVNRFIGDLFAGK